MRRPWGGAALVFMLALAGCATPPAPPAGAPPPAAVPPAPRVVYEPADWSALPGWRNDDLAAAWPAFLASCGVMRARPQWSAPCAAAAAIPAGSGTIRDYFTRYFQPWRMVREDAAGRARQGLVTGYFEPLLRGSRRPSARYSTPLYAPPPDLLTVDLASLYPELKGRRVRGRLQGNKVVPYYTRAQLARDPALKGHELLWIDGALDAFLLEVQGSGRVQLPDGSMVRVQYADQNGQPYQSIGRYLVRQGALTPAQATMPGIRAWLEAHPQRLREVLDANPSVVFFSEAPLGDPNLGPRGAQGVALTAGRSIAVDPAYVPLGTPVFLSTVLPPAAGGKPLQRLVMAQDTGGAIAGAPRADFFFGTGPEAESLAGQMRAQGAMWILWPKDAPLPTP